MKKIKTIIACLLTSTFMQAQKDYTHGLSVWFDQPTSLKGRPVWYGGRPDLWRGKGKPETAGKGDNISYSDRRIQLHKPETVGGVN
jgi:alpha-L-fucosidase 2